MCFKKQNIFILPFHLGPFCARDLLVESNFAASWQAVSTKRSMIAWGTMREILDFFVDSMDCSLEVLLSTIVDKAIAR